MVTQTKPPIGTTVDFTKAKEILNIQKICYNGDIIGLLGYQATPATVDSATRDAWMNGNMADIQTQIDGQGMTTRYVTVSWNETQQSGNYFITDFRIGVVVQIARDYNTGPNYILTSLKAVPWLNQAISKLSFPWKAWEMTSMNRPDPSYLHCVEELVSDPIWVGFPINNTPTPLPTADSVKAAIAEVGNSASAMGTFAQKMSDNGFAVTFLTPNSYGVDVCFYQSPIGQAPGNPYYRAYYYKLHVRLWWDVSTVPDVLVRDTPLPVRLLPQYAVVLIWVLVAIILATGVAWSLVTVANNLTHQESSWTKKTTYYNPDGTVNRTEEESGSQSGPPDWWGWVIPIIVIIGAVTVAGFLWNLRPQRRQTI